MAENQGEALATIGEIAQGHGDVLAALRDASRSPFERLAEAWLDEVADAAAERPYAVAAVGAAFGLLGGLALAYSTQRRRARLW